jgi:hypothetical protein
LGAERKWARFSTILITADCPWRCPCVKKRGGNSIAGRATVAGFGCDKRITRPTSLAMKRLSPQAQLLASSSLYRPRANIIIIVVDFSAAQSINPIGRFVRCLPGTHIVAVAASTRATAWSSVRPKNLTALANDVKVVVYMEIRRIAPPPSPRITHCHYL